LGYPGPEVVEKVPNIVEGIKVKTRNEKVSITINYKYYIIAKAI
jgi:hypothetical protein